MDHTSGRHTGAAVNKVWVAALLAGVVLLLSGCGLLQRDAAEPAPPTTGGVGLLTCTEICAGRGQCGERDGRVKVILGNMLEPVVEPYQHDIFYDEGTAVTIVDFRDRQVVILADDLPQSARFLLVRPQGSAAPRDAWVVEWCFTTPD